MKQTTFRTLLSIAGKKKIVKHYDINNVFLSNNLEEIIYMQQPQGYEVDKTKVCKLRKGLYSLKQTAKGWNKTLDNVLQKIGFKRSNIDPCLYMNITEGKYTYLIIYVDDILIAGDNQKFMSHIECILDKTFNVTDLGE